MDGLVSSHTAAATDNDSQSPSLPSGQFPGGFHRHMAPALGGIFKKYSMGRGQGRYSQDQTRNRYVADPSAEGFVVPHPPAGGGLRAQPGSPGTPTPEERINSEQSLLPSTYGHSHDQY